VKETILPLYQIDKKITSVLVDVKLLQELEKYILDTCKNQSHEKSRINYTATIYDEYGKEEIESFEQYHRSTLPNETKKISLKIYDYNNDFSIRVNFSEEKTFSYLTVQISNNSAKEKVNGIVNHIQSYLKEYENMNFIFYSWLIYIPWIIAPAILGGTISALSLNGLTENSIAGLIIVFVVFILYILKRLSPYSTFDTKHNQKILSGIKWLINGLAGVFIFGLIAIYIRQQIGF